MPVLVAADRSPIPPPPSDPAEIAGSALLEDFDVHSPPAAAPDAALEQLGEDARAVAPLVQSGWVRELLQQVRRLPPAPDRTLYHDDTRYFTQAEYEALDAGERAGLAPQPVDGTLYYYTKYGSPVAYARPLDSWRRPA